MKIYCVHPISGRSGDEVFTYYDGIRDRLRNMGYDVLIPMFGKDSMRTELKFKAHSYSDNPLTTNHAIFNRDHWMVGQADIIYANLLGAQHVSIGSMFELAWASHMGKNVILVMEDDSIHQHGFVLEAATAVFKEEDTALTYLEQLVQIDSW